MTCGVPGTGGWICDGDMGSVRLYGSLQVHLWCLVCVSRDRVKRAVPSLAGACWFRCLCKFDASRPRCLPVYVYCLHKMLSRYACPGRICATENRNDVGNEGEDRDTYRVCCKESCSESHVKQKSRRCKFRGGVLVTSFTWCKLSQVKIA
jgi:hypothetical protein